MKFQILSVFPAFFESYLREGVLAQALQKNIYSFEILNPRNFASDHYKSVDDRPFGGGDGMVLLPEIIEACLQARKEQDDYIIYLSPQGKKIDEKKVIELMQHKTLTFICGRYGGVDQRVLNEYVDEEISLGDFVISGGELGALAVMDAVIRKLPGSLGHQDSAQEDSFAQDGMLEHPLFTRPQNWKGKKIPAILLSGHHEKIKIWKKQMSELITLKKRPDLLKNRNLKDLKKFYDGLSSEEKKVCDVEDMESCFE